MAVLRKPRTWAALGLLCIAASAAALVISGGLVGGPAKPAPSPDEEGSIAVATDISKPGYRVARLPVVEVGTTIAGEVRPRVVVVGVNIHAASKAATRANGLA